MSQIIVRHLGYFQAPESSTRLSRNLFALPKLQCQRLADGDFNHSYSSYALNPCDKSTCMSWNIPITPYHRPAYGDFAVSRYTPHEFRLYNKPP